MGDGCGEGREVRVKEGDFIMEIVKRDLFGEGGFYEVVGIRN